MMLWLTLCVLKKTWQHPHGIDEGSIWNQEIRQDKVVRSMELLSVSILNEKPPSDFFSLICWSAIHLTWKPTRCFTLEYLCMSKHLGQHGGYKLTVYYILSLFTFSEHHYADWMWVLQQGFAQDASICVSAFPCRPFLRPMSSSLCSLI